jgi:hypothetical protein
LKPTSGFLWERFRPIVDFFWKKLHKRFMFLNFFALSQKTYGRKEVDFINLNSPETDKKSFIGKTPFIASKIEKLWI